VKLSFDQPIQYAAFKALEVAVKKSGARSGSAIVRDAHTDEILAMTNWPSYDPNSNIARTGRAMRNRAVTDVFEPGSVMKPFTVALALQQHRVTPNSIVPTDGGHLRLDGATIHDDKTFGTLTVTGVVQKSSNVGTTKIAMLMKPASMWRNFDQIGLGHSPHAGLPGASGGDSGRSRIGGVSSRRRCHMAIACRRRFYNSRKPTLQLRMTGVCSCDGIRAKSGATAGKAGLFGAGGTTGSKNDASGCLGRRNGSASGGTWLQRRR